MPWRMLRFLIIMAIVILFVGLNAGHTSNIRFWFGDKAYFENVPIFISLFGAYVLGALSVIPFAVNRSISKFRKKQLKKKVEKDSVDTTTSL